MTVDTTAIARIGQARQLLAAAKDLDDIKAVRDMAEAARLYARAAGLGQQAMNEAAEIKLRAERKAGEVLAEMDRARPGPAPKIDSQAESISRPPRLADIGITPKQSMNWQAEAALPEPDFEEWVEERKQADEPLTTTGLVRKAREQHEAQDRADTAQVVTVLEERDHDGEMARTRLLAQYSRGIKAACELTHLHAQPVVRALGHERRLIHREHARMLRTWLDAIEIEIDRAEAPPLQMMGGTRG